MPVTVVSREKEWEGKKKGKGRGVGKEKDTLIDCLIEIGHFLDKTRDRIRDFEIELKTGSLDPTWYTLKDGRS